MRFSYNQTKYLTSATKLEQLPPDEGIEIAFAGRSNAGKSSAINTITGVKGLAKTSKTPGRTQMINLFQLAEQRLLVDLPGYGYAKVPIAMKQRWQQTMEQYFSERQALVGVVLVMDVRHPLTDFDQAMLQWCAGANMSVHVLLTKSDKLKRGPASATLHKVRKILEEEYGGGTAQLFSSLKKTGIDEVRHVLEQWMGDEKIPSPLENAGG